MATTPPTPPPPSGPAGGPPGGDYPVPPFDPAKPHHQRPKLRQVRAFSAQQGENVFLGLTDARQISQRVVLVHPAFQMVLPLLDGSRDVEQVVEQVGQGLQRPMLEQLVAQLDAAGLLEGPTFEAMRRELEERFDASDHLPPSFTADFAEALVQAQAGDSELSEEEKQRRAPQALRQQLDRWIDEALKDASDPSFDEPPRAIVAPHIDYSRGWMNYAHAWGRMRVVDRPDRLVVLGTNHYGQATGVCACDKGFATPLGLCPYDEAFAHALMDALGSENADKLFAHRYDHEREHSIELQLPWAQHTLGGVGEDAAPIPVFAALVHDPSVNAGESYDGQGLGLEPFVEALKQAIAASPGRTLIVCSADLSHVGPMFGDQAPVTGEEADKPDSLRNKAIQHDREMLQLFAQGDAQAIVSSMAWMQNPTRWCSTGAMVATLLALEAPRVRMLNYGGAIDQAGTCMVTSCAAAVF